MHLIKLHRWMPLALMTTLLLACGGEEQTNELPPVVPPPPPAVTEPEPEFKPIEPVSTPTPTFSASTGQSTAGNYVIQVGVQPTRNAAQKQVASLKESGIDAYVVEVENPGELEGTYYRVRIGFWPTIAEAKAWSQSTLGALGLAWWVDNRSNDAVGNPGGSDYGSYEHTPEPAAPPARTDWGSSVPATPAPAATQSPPPPAANDGWGTPAPAVQPTPPPAATPTPTAPPAAPTDGWGAPAAPATNATPPPADEGWGTPPPQTTPAPAGNDDWN